MRKHRRFEKISPIDVTVQMRSASPRDLMNLIKEDVDIEVRARAGAYSNGSASYPIPRTMDISRFSRMSSKPLPPIPPTPSTPPTPPAPEPPLAQ